MAVTVIIPTRNEEAHVARCLDSVLGQIQGRKDVEVICVDGASTDRTRQIIARYCRQDGRITLLDNAAKIVPAGLNLGLAQALGDVILRMDCHATYAPDYIARCEEVLERTNADNVGGYITTVPASDSAVGRAIASAITCRFGIGNAPFRLGGGEREAGTVPFGCFQRQTFQRFGLYDERLVRNQDIELNWRIRKGGGRIVISPAIRSTYYCRSTFGGLRAQAFQNGFWSAYTFLTVGGGVHPRHGVPLGFVLGLLLLGIAGFAWPVMWDLLIGTTLVYLLCGIAAAHRASGRTGACRALILATFLQMHLAYGFGSLWGVLTTGWRPRAVQLCCVPVGWDRPRGTCEPGAAQRRMPPQAQASKRPPSSSVRNAKRSCGTLPSV